MNPRIGTAADIPELVRVINAAYRVEDFFIDGDRTSAEDVAARIKAPGACFLVIDGEVSGTLAASVWLETVGDRGHFVMLAVDPAHQGRGLARRLIEEVEDHCRNAGCSALDIEVVNLREELPPLYEAVGFRRTGVEEFLDTGQLKRPAHLIVMSKPI
ncbi:MAG: N-acetyltransferase family protein [Gemmatimonadaceae bacterium]